jgi:hypothetical protein
MRLHQRRLDARPNYYDVSVAIGFGFGSGVAVVLLEAPIGTVLAQ